VISGGSNNVARYKYATVSGGYDNFSGDTAATIGGGYDNQASGWGAMVGGGEYNLASGGASTIGGGSSNLAGETWSTVGGGGGNHATGENSTISGGMVDTASALLSTVGGGGFNGAHGSYSTIGGGGFNSAAGGSATIAGGDYNTAGGLRSTIGGGYNNVASGECAVITGGCSNLTSGDYSLAMGSGAKALHNGSLVWADASVDGLESTADNQMMMMASGGTWIYADPDLHAGVTIHPGASAWATYSDVNLKEHLSAVDGEDILRKISSLPINDWNLKAQSDDIRHIGPTAQDFYDTFGLGESEKTISTVDADGVALAAIQGLLNKIEQLEKRIAKLEDEKR
jgi:hypothetical protein